MAKQTLFYIISAEEMALIKTKRPYFITKLNVPAEPGQRIIFQVQEVVAAEGVNAVPGDELDATITHVHPLGEKKCILSVPTSQVQQVIDMTAAPITGPIAQSM